MKTYWRPPPTSGHGCASAGAIDLASSIARRPLRSRHQRWAAAAARRLTQAGVRPDTISVISIAFAAFAAAALLVPARAPAARVVMLTTAALCIQLRLLCNLLDGMVAIEGGRGTAAGEVFNDAPDRIADALVLVAAGYSITSVAWGRDLGWTAALLAVGTAYVRLLGTSLGLPADFRGPMAKPHRMAVMTAASLIGALEAAVGAEGRAIPLGLLVVFVGSALTVGRRLVRIVRALESRPKNKGGPS